MQRVNKSSGSKGKQEQINEEFGRVLATVFENQVAISNSQKGTDAKTAVMLRLFISTLNEVVSKFNALTSVDLMAHDPKTEKPYIIDEPGLHVDKIDIELINKMFEDYSKFDARADKEEHFQHWYMGRPLDELPEVKVTEEGEDGDAPEYPEDATIFGGDYDTEEKAAETSDVPPLQVADDSEGESADKESSNVLQEVQDIPRDESPVEATP